MKKNLVSLFGILLIIASIVFLVVMWVSTQDTSLGKMSLPVLIGISAAALVIGVLVILKGRRF